VHELPVSLEHFYSGRTAKLAITRNRLCDACDGRGSNKPGVDAKCTDCGGHGRKMVTRQLGPGFIQQMQVTCPTCAGRGSTLKPEDRCPSCSGEQVVKHKKIFEVVIEKGSQKGDHVAFNGEGDQIPGVKLSGDIIIVFDEKPHDQFVRKGDHLLLEHSVTLVEALTGFHRLVKHLDGRTLVIAPPPGSVLDPASLYSVNREGMPIPNTGGGERGNLLVKFAVKYPETIADPVAKQLRQLLGAPPEEPLPTDYEEGTLVKTTLDPKSLPRRRGDSDEEEDGRPRGHTAQCAQQ